MYVYVYIYYYTPTGAVSQCSPSALAAARPREGSISTRLAPGQPPLPRRPSLRPSCAFGGRLRVQEEGRVGEDQRRGRAQELPARVRVLGFKDRRGRGLRGRSWALNTCVSMACVHACVRTCMASCARDNGSCGAWRMKETWQRGRSGAWGKRPLWWQGPPRLTYAGAARELGPQSSSPKQGRDEFREVRNAKRSPGPRSGSGHTACQGVDGVKRRSQKTEPKDGAKRRSQKTESKGGQRCLHPKPLRVLRL
jgi:hypothetical protein